MAAVARASAHRRMKDDEMVAHYIRAVERPPVVSRLIRLARPVVSSAATTCIVRTTTTRAASDADYDSGDHALQRFSVRWFAVCGQYELDRKVK